MQCKAIAKSTREQCKNEALGGTEHCFGHSNVKLSSFDAISVGLSYVS